MACRIREKPGSLMMEYSHLDKKAEKNLFYSLIVGRQLLPRVEYPDERIALSIREPF
jgi:hypothetical protein